MLASEFQWFRKFSVYEKVDSTPIFREALLGRVNHISFQEVASLCLKYKVTEAVRGSRVFMGTFLIMDF